MSVGAVTISRFKIPAGHEKEYEGMLRSFGDEVQDDSGFISTSVWKDLDRAGEFMRITAFRDFDALFQSYDEMVENGFLEEAVERWGVAPDVRRQIPVYSKNFEFKQLGKMEFLSLSVRAMEPGQGPAWIEKMKYNFAEIEILPGMRGCWIGQHDEIDDEIAGIVIWDSLDACRQSIPEPLHYPIHVFARYR